MPLHIDYRPITLDDIIGNESSKKVLRELIKKSTRPHSYLFFGDSGCGKTTLARIYASMLGCFPKDIKEVNSANNRGIDTAREIIDEMKFPSVTGNIRVYLLDEFHQTTKDFQNALLKALEDTPSHVYFFLCTTDIKKVIPTIRNRCTQIEVNSLSNEEMFGLLKIVLEREKVARTNPNALVEITKKAEGCPRQALTILEKIYKLPLSEQKKAITDFKKSETNVFDLVKNLGNPDLPWKFFADLLKIFKEEGINPEEIRQTIINYYCSILLNSPNTTAALIMDTFWYKQYPLFPELVYLIYGLRLTIKKGEK